MFRFLSGGMKGIAKETATTTVLTLTSAAAASGVLFFAQRIGEPKKPAFNQSSSTGVSQAGTSKK